MLPADDVTTPSHRLPDDLQLGLVHLQVADLARSLEYYERVIGLTALSMDGSEVLLGVATGSVPLVMLHQRMGTRPAGRHARLGLYHFAILLPDRVSLGRLLAHLGSLRIPAATADHAVSEAVYLWDPDGLGIEVYADRPRREWRRRAGEIYMTTEPLDLNALLAAASGQHWTGMPARTRMGHMHLHVGSLAEAELFYDRALGMDKTVASYPGALFMSAGGYHHHLGVNTWAGKAPAAGADEARLLEWTIHLPTAADADAAAARTEAAGYHVTRDAHAWQTIDPWGTTLRVVGSSL
jgi:catechol 2,3-dioxygenase